MEPVKAKLLMDRWDSLTPQQKQMEILKMPPVCHVCGSGGDGMHFMPDAAVGYTKLLCSTCCRNCLLQGFNDDDHDDDEAPNICFSGAAAMQPDSSAFASAPSSSPNRDAPSISFQVGSRVRVTGLVAAKQHNGKMGTVSIAIDAVTERLGVELDEGASLKIKASNLVPLSPAPASISGAAVTRSTSSAAASTPSIGSLPFTPSKPLSHTSPSDDPPAPAPFDSWVSAARAQSLNLTGHLCPPLVSVPSLRCSHQF